MLRFTLEKKKNKFRNYKSIHKSMFSPPSEGAARFHRAAVTQPHHQGMGEGGESVALLPLTLAAGR